LVVAGGVAVVLRLMLTLLMHSGGHRAVVGNGSQLPVTVALPAWPLKPGDVLSFRPGDSNLAKWGADPKTEPFIVSKVIPGGVPAVPNTSLCVFAPDYVADASQPGGTLTVEGQDLIVGWRTHWRGGDTVPAELKKPDYDPRCGRDAELLLTATQLHDLVNALAGLPKPPPEPGVQAGATIALPQP
jgi:hypothetical protein